MDARRRRTIDLDPADTAAVAPFLDEGSDEHAALERLVGEPLDSDAAVLRALAVLGAERVSGSMLEDAYNRAVDAGDFQETREWVERSSTARQHRHAGA